MMSIEQAAAPYLGSHLLSLTEKHKPSQTGVSCGSTLVDDAALTGGLRYGEVTSIAGSSSTGKTSIAYHAAASHLLSSEHGEVVFVDTKGSFSAERLRDIVALRMRNNATHHKAFKETGYVYREVAPLEHTGNEIVEANKILDRVKLMTVFNIEGLAEAVGEIGQALEKSNETRGNSRSDDGEKKIIDSEDGIEGDLSERDQTSESRVGVLIVDIIANIVNPLLSKNYVQGQALLSSLIRSIKLLTINHHLCTILINSVVNPRSSSGSRDGKASEEASIFTSISGKPGLGKPFAYLVDTSILVSRYGKTVKQPFLMYVEEREQTISEGEEVLILEVLSDRHGSREGRWSAFEVTDDYGIRGRGVQA